MHFSSLLSVSTLLLAARASERNSLESRELEDRHHDNDGCPESGPTPTVVIGPVVVHYPVQINNYYEQNTIININGGPTININNAPTYINTIVTASSTITTTSTVTAIPTSTSAPFFLQINEIVLGKRQAARLLVGPDGISTTSCNGAAYYSITADQRLLSDGQPITGNATSTGELFTFQSGSGSIGTAFALVNGVLVWQNALFTVSEVLFCLLDGFVNAIFNGILPPGCSSISLEYLDPANCANNGTSTSGSLSSTTSGAFNTTSTTSRSFTTSTSLLITAPNSIPTLSTTGLYLNTTSAL